LPAHARAVAAAAASLVQLSNNATGVKRSADSAGLTGDSQSAEAGASASSQAAAAAMRSDLHELHRHKRSKADVNRKVLEDLVQEGRQNRIATMAMFADLKLQLARLGESMERSAGLVSAAIVQSSGEDDAAMNADKFLKLAGVSGATKH
jgi:hypothetical protein